MATMTKVNGVKLADPAEKNIKLGSKAAETRTSIVERLLGKPMSQIGKNELVALIIAQYGACQNLMEALADTNPAHPMIVGLVPKQPKWKLILSRIKCILK